MVFLCEKIELFNEFKEVEKEEKQKEKQKKKKRKRGGVRGLSSVSEWMASR